jgi:hypothetical protein
LDQLHGKQLGQPRSRSRLRPVDRVIAILAVGLVFALCLVLIGSILAVLEHELPMNTLGENTTQVLTGITGGIIGIIGAYVGNRTRSIDQDNKQQTETQDEN